MATTYTKVTQPTTSYSKVTQNSTSYSKTSQPSTSYSKTSQNSVQYTKAGNARLVKVAGQALLTTAGKQIVLGVLTSYTKVSYS